MAGRTKGGEGTHQPALEDVLARIESLQPLPGLGFCPLQPLDKLVAQFAERFQPLLQGLGGFRPALCGCLPGLRQGKFQTGALRLLLLELLGLEGFQLFCQLVLNGVEFFQAVADLDGAADGQNDIRYIQGK